MIFGARNCAPATIAQSMHWMRCSFALSVSSRDRAGNNLVPLLADQSIATTRLLGRDGSQSKQSGSRSRSMVRRLEACGGGEVASAPMVVT